MDNHDTHVEAIGTLEECFSYLGLYLDATRDDADEQYGFITGELRKMCGSDLNRFNRKAATLDAHYGVVLRHFIREECRKGQESDRGDYLSFADITRRRYEPGVIPGWLKAQRAAKEAASRAATPEATEEHLVAFPVGGQAADGTEQPNAGTGKVFEMVETEADIFDAPMNSIVVHSVNCLGFWGKGFAEELGKRCPNAFAAYQKYCQGTEHPSDNVGKCLLIPLESGNGWVACLFTSVGYGSPNTASGNPGRDSEWTILSNTDTALLDLRDQLKNLDTIAGTTLWPNIYSPKFNSGLFGVPWEHTQKLIEICFNDYPATWNVAVRKQSTEKQS